MSAYWNCRMIARNWAQATKLSNDHFKDQELRYICRMIDYKIDYRWPIVSMSTLYARISSGWSAGWQYTVICWQYCKVGFPRNKQKNSVQTETNRNKNCFGLFRENKNKKIWFVSVCFDVSNLYHTNETNRTVSKQTETTLNFRKNPK
jgi:hypothetical protein